MSKMHQDPPTAAECLRRMEEEGRYPNPEAAIASGDHAAAQLLIAQAAMNRQGRT